MTGTEQTDWTVMITMVFLGHDLCYIVLKLQTLALTQLGPHISVQMHSMVVVVKQGQVIILNQLFCNCGSVFICFNAALSRVKMTRVIIYILPLRLLESTLLIPRNILNITRHV